MRRLTGLLCMLVMTLLACSTVSPQKPAPKPAPVLPYSSGEIQDIYKSYNREYWNGKLPAVTVIWTALPEGRFGQTEKDDNGRFIIKLDVVKNRESNVAKTTVLHEMCHVKTWGEDCHIPGTPNKCRRWLAELHRIMLEGAFDDLV
jgi:hypothetical protein